MVHVETVLGTGESVVLLDGQGDQVFVLGLVSEESAQWKIKKVSKPTEASAPITDNARRELDKLTLRIGLDERAQLEQLRRLMNAFVVVDVVAGLAVHPSMLITGISPSMATTCAIEATINFEEHRTVSTRLVQLPAQNKTGRGGRRSGSADAEVVKVMAEAAGAAGNALAPATPADGANAASSATGAGLASGGSVTGKVGNKKTGVLDDHARTWPQE